MEEIGALLLSIAGPLFAYHAVRTRDATSIGWMSLWVWGLGEVFLVAALYPEHVPLLINYIINLISVLIIMKVKYDDNS